MSPGGDWNFCPSYRFSEYGRMPVIETVMCELSSLSFVSHRLLCTAKKKKTLLMRNRTHIVPQLHRRNGCNRPCVSLPRIDCDRFGRFYRPRMFFVSECGKYINCEKIRLQAFSRVWSAKNDSVVFIGLKERDLNVATRYFIVIVMRISNNASIDYNFDIIIDLIIWWIIHLLPRYELLMSINLIHRIITMY